MKEYKTVSVEFSFSLEHELNKYAQEGWQAVSVTKNLNSDYVIVLERDKPEQKPYPYKKPSW